jgi:hypothetical protein
MQEKYKWLLLGVVLGIVAAPQIKKIPGVNRIPSI